MGLFFGIALTGVVLVGVWRLLRRTSERQSFLTQFRARPLWSLYLLTWVVSLLGFFWGLVFNVTLYFDTPFGRISFLTMCGALALIGLVVSEVWTPKNNSRS